MGPRMFTAVGRTCLKVLMALLLGMAALVMLVAVMADFFVFRLKVALAGPQTPKGVWEF